MSLCTSIPATRSYITFILLATSCSGNPLPMGTGAPTARAPDQYRRLTHAHAAAAGGTRQGAPAPFFTTASNGPNSYGDGRRHTTATVHLRPRIHRSRQKPRPPTAGNTPAAQGDPVF